MTPIFSIAFLALFSIVCMSYAQQEFVHPLTDMPGPSEDIETSFVYPEYDFKADKFPLGETITVLCHFSNDGAAPVNITAIMGSLNHALDFRYHIQNYTYKPFGIVVKGGEEITLQYQFQAHPELEPADYALAHTVFYHSEVEAFSSTFFNQTVSLYVSNVEADAASIAQLLFALGFMVAVVVIAYVACKPDVPLEMRSNSNVQEDSSWDDDFVVKRNTRYRGKGSKVN